MTSSYRLQCFGILILLVSAFTTFAQKPELLLRTGQAGVSSIAFSPDGKILASSDGRKIKIWDVASGQELRTLTAPAGLEASAGIGSIAFVQGNNTLAEASQNFIRFWNIENGSVLHTINAPPDMQLAETSGVGRLVAINSYGVTKLRDLNTGVPIRTFKEPNIDVMALSDDGKTLASVSSEPNPLTVPDRKTIKLWNVDTGTEKGTVTQDDNVTKLALSRDGSILAIETIGGVLKLWNVSTGAVQRTFKRNASCLAFAEDGNILAIGEPESPFGSPSDGIALIDPATGKDLRKLKAQTDAVSSLAFSSDGRMLASGTNGHSVALWNLTSGGALRALGKNNNAVNSVVFSPDNKLLATGSDDIKLWDISSGRGVQRILLPDVISVLAFSNDSTTVGVKGGDGKVIELYDTKTGAKLRSFTGHSDIVNSIGFSVDGVTLASGSNDDTVRVWNADTGTQQRFIKANLKGVQSIAFSPNGKVLAGGGHSKSIKLWDPTTGALLRSLIGHTEVRSLAFSSDGKMLASNGDDIVEVWNVTTGTLLQKFSDDDVRGVALSTDGKILAIAGSDGNVQLIEISTGNELASLIVVGEQDWLVVTPDGLFDGSPSAWTRIFWRFSRSLYDIAPVEIFFNEFYYPDLLADLIAGRRPHAVSDVSKIDRHQPGLKFALPSGLPSPSGISTREFNVKIDVTDASAGAKDLRLFRNGSLVKVWHEDILKGQSHVELEATIPIVAGENRLTAYAFNHDNIKSTDAEVIVMGEVSPKRKGVAYILAIGLNEYANTQYNLKYAVADAEDFADELKRQQARLNNYEGVELISLNDRDATKANILKSLADLSAKVQPEDALVIFFAGHGTAQQNRFYLIPHDLGYNGSRTQLDSAALQNILAHSISDEEISRAVEGIDAGQMLLVIDACNSGQALEAEEKRRGPMNSKGLAQLAYEKGMYILTAAQSYQAANEAERYGHGFLTYALVEEGLKTSVADKEPKDGQVLLREWLDFATDRVPQMQQDKLEEQQKLGRQLDRIKFAETDAGNERSIQRPRVFYRRETETHPLVIARPKEL